MCAVVGVQRIAAFGVSGLRFVVGFCLLSLSFMLRVKIVSSLVFIISSVYFDVFIDRACLRLGYVRRFSDIC